MPIPATISLHRLGRRCRRRPGQRADHRAIGGWGRRSGSLSTAGGRADNSSGQSSRLGLVRSLWRGMRRVQGLGAARYAGAPCATHCRKTPTRSAGHEPSQGIVPSSSRARIAEACSLTSSCDQRSKCDNIEVRSLSRKSGLMSTAKLTGSALVSKVVVGLLVAG